MNRKSSSKSSIQSTTKTEDKPAKKERVPISHWTAPPTSNSRKDPKSLKRGGLVGHADNPKPKSATDKKVLEPRKGLSEHKSKTTLNIDYIDLNEKKGSTDEHKSKNSTRDSDDITVVDTSEKPPRSTGIKHEPLKNDEPIVLTILPSHEQKTLETIEALQTLIESKNKTEREERINLKQIRYQILKTGIPHSKTPTGTLRSDLWKILLKVYKIPSSEYISLILQKSPFDLKIKSDTNRTLQTDQKFKQIVNEKMLIRILNAFCVKVDSIPKKRFVNWKFGYVQGMNVLCAPFLYVMQEIEGFYSFYNFVVGQCPLYVQPCLEGVHCGVKLVDRFLEEFDRELCDFLKSNGIEGQVHQTNQVYAFPWVMTFSACLPPLDNVVQLWDFLLSFGIHLNILCIVSILMKNRTIIMCSKSPIKVLRELVLGNAQGIINDTMGLIKKCPEDLYDLLVRHPYDVSVYDQLFSIDEW